MLYNQTKLNISQISRTEAFHMDVSYVSYPPHSLFFYPSWNDGVVIFWAMLTGPYVNDWLHLTKTTKC